MVKSDLRTGLFQSTANLRTHTCKEPVASEM